MKKATYAVFGVSGFGREVMPILRQQLQSSQVQPLDVVFVDDAAQPTVVNGHRDLTYAQWLAEPAEERFITIAIANSAVRQKLVERCQADGVQFIEVRARNVVQLDECELGEGAILCPFVTLTSNVKIGKQFHANIYSYVAHDCIIGDYVTLAPSVKCNGNVFIDDHAYLGTGAILKQGKPGEPLVIGKGAVVGMGAVVTKSVPPGVTVIGIEPNVRGSDRYGKTWLAADDGPKRLRVTTDIEDVANHVRAAFAVGGKAPKVGVMGGSYGGYSTLEAMTKFAGAFDAGVANVGMSNLLTFLENTAPYRRALRISEYGDPTKDREALVELSPITHIDKLSAPLLLIQGANDPRVPVGEAIQMHDALEKRGKTTKMVVFPDGGHGTQKRENKVLEIGYTLDWLRTHLTATP